jgi:hypothetical protein
MNVIMGQRTTIESIKHGCLAHFSIKSFNVQPNVMEIDFYHQTHTQTNGDHAHNAGTRVHIMDVSVCSTCISQVEGVYMDPIKVRVHHEANL